MTNREQKAIFTVAILFMFFGGFVSSILYCPPPLDNELPLVFVVGVAETLLPAFLFLFVARKLSGVK